MKINYKTSVFIITIVALLVILTLARYLALENNKISNELITTQNELTFVKEELSNIQQDLSAEVEKTIQLNNLLDNINVELEIAKMTIDDLKNTEYELMYMGDFKYTYYCNEPYEHICGYGLGLTASGRPTEVGWTVAADTSVLPMGSIIYVEGVGFRKVMDVGGGVKGHHIDILLNTHAECFEQTIVNGGVWVLIQKDS